MIYSYITCVLDVLGVYLAKLEKYCSPVVLDIWGNPFCSVLEVDFTSSLVLLKLYNCTDFSNII